MSSDHSRDTIGSFHGVAVGRVETYEPPAVTVLGTLAELTLDVKSTLHNFDATLAACAHMNGTNDSHKSCV
jgi:hypothetical protein